MKILYITYIDFGKAESGSTMRPQKMYRAFCEEGHEVKLLCGTQNIKSRKKRIAAVREIRAWLQSNRPDICYIESPVYPILWHADRKLIRDICAMGIPTAYFTRDCYDRLPELFPKRKDFRGRIKDQWLAYMRRLTEKTLEHVDITYFPSLNMTRFFSFRDMRELPPAGENHLSDITPEKNRCVYVGGILNQYGGDMLIEAFRILNRGDEKYPLTLICREKEWEQFPAELKGDPWVEVHHASGDELIPLLGRAEVGLLIAANDYWNYSYSIKLFEYMGYGLPAVFTHGEPIDRLTGRLGTGIAVERSAEALADGIRRMLEDRGEYSEYCANTRKALVEGQMWEHRVRQIIHDLQEIKRG